jgi:hypothetical protein
MMKFYEGKIVGGAYHVISKETLEEPFSCIYASFIPIDQCGLKIVA